MSQQPSQELPSVEVDPDVDNHEIEAAICRSWLISEAGRLAKVENPNGYKNVLLHMKAHMMIMQEQMMQQQQAQIEQEAQNQNQGNNTPKKGKSDRKIKGEGDVNAELPIQQQFC